MLSLTSEHVGIHSVEPCQLKVGFSVCTGAGSFTEPGDGGWNTSTGDVSAYKPALKYSNVRMSDGGSFTGNVVVHVTATTFRVRLNPQPLAPDWRTLASRFSLSKLQLWFTVHRYLHSLGRAHDV